MEIDEINPTEEIEYFKKTYLEPLKKRWDKGNKLLNGFKLKEGSDEEQKAKSTLKNIEDRIIDYKKIIRLVSGLINKNNKISILYDIWESEIAYEGKQPTEIMQGQADKLTDIFKEIKQLTK